MMGKTSKRHDDKGRHIVAQNRRARYDYSITDTLEAGIVLHGTEVRSLRQGLASLKESYASITKQGELVLLNAHIASYDHATDEQNHEPTRIRSLLVHAREKKRLQGAIKKKGYTLVPLNIHFNRRGIAKLELALALGKKKYDKREKEKEKIWRRENQAVLRRR
ncbi:MAG: SsrA-binding protein SmpB [Alphaproteobacteria bacterium GM7ARS4]|nr:SsrA-binding protein SmpB [Alphaproteobacteria bacterium GM7ARS4]